MKWQKVETSISSWKHYFFYAQFNEEAKEKRACVRVFVWTILDHEKSWIERKKEKKNSIRFGFWFGSGFNAATLVIDSE